MKEKKEGQIQTSIYLPKEVHTELRIRALKEGISMTKLILRAVYKELDLPLKEIEKGTQSELH